MEQQIKNCQNCKQGFIIEQTTYSPDKKEIVYCEECYRAEIY